MVDMDQCRRLVELTAKKNHLEGELRAVKAEIDGVQEILGDVFANEGLQNLKDVMGCTLYKRTDLFVSKAPDVEMHHFCNALRSNELGFALSYAWSTLRSWLKERLDDAGVKTEGAEEDELKEPFPEEMRELLNVSTRTRVCVRGAGGMNDAQ